MRLAVNMAGKGKSLEEIAEVLDLDTDEVKGLLKESQQSNHMHVLQ